MALGQTQQSAPIQVNPAELIGKPDTGIVEPRAVAILGDAFRQGVITADDIINRTDENAQAKKKAELQMAQEATSPAAQAARAQQLATSTAVGSVQQAQAERAKVIAQYPAVEYFDKLAAKAGIAEPKLPDGTPDYKEMEKIGLELATDVTKKLTAKEERENINAQFDNDNQVVRAFTKQGAPVDPNRVRELDRVINTPFSRQTPGTMSTAPVVEARVAASAPAGPLEDLTVVRTRLANKMGPEVVAGMDEENLRQLATGETAPAPLVEARGTPAAVAPAPVAGAALPFGTPTSGGYAMGGTPKSPPAGKVSTAEQDKANLALSRFAESQNIQDALKVAGYDPTSYGSWFNSILPQVVKSGDRKLYETAQQAWAQGLLRLESGAAISPREQVWYSQTFFPTVSDPPAVVNAKAGLRANVERTMAEIAQKGGVVSPEAVRNAALLAQSAAGRPGAAASSGGAAPVIPLPSGRKITRDASGNYVYVE